VERFGDFLSIKIKYKELKNKKIDNRNLDL
jgi:hypothetical protein